MKQVRIVAPSNNDARRPLPNQQPLPPNRQAAEEPAPPAPIAVISPARRYIVMDETVARERGLDLTARAPAPENRVHYRAHCNRLGLPEGLANSARLYRRAARTLENDKQEARISISHDGHYATAVCIAVPLEQPKHPRITIDMGMGPPMHRPLDSDRGYDGASREVEDETSLESHEAEASPAVKRTNEVGRLRPVRGPVGEREGVDLDAAKDGSVVNRGPEMEQIDGSLGKEKNVNEAEVDDVERASHEPTDDEVAQKSYEPSRDETEDVDGDVDKERFRNQSEEARDDEESSTNRGPVTETPQVEEQGVEPANLAESESDPKPAEEEPEETSPLVPKRRGRPRKY